MSKQGSTNRLVKAQMEVEIARKQLASTIGTIQYRTKPARLANDTWEGVRGKSSEVADGALSAIKERPMVASGIIAGALVFLAREPLWRTLTGFFSRHDDEALVTTRIDTDHRDYDITAPVVERAGT